MKTLLLFFCIFFQFNLFAQETLAVKDPVLDLGVLTETLGRGVKKVVLELDESSPGDFKVKFKYKYQFISHELDTVILTQNGVGGYTTKRRVEDYVGKETLRFDISESSVRNGDKIRVSLEISKPNKNIHGIQIKVVLLDESSNSLNGGKKLFGLLGRSYTILENCSN